MTTHALDTPAVPWRSLRVDLAGALESATTRSLRVLIVVNAEWYFLSHRLALAKALIDAGCGVTVAASEDRNFGAVIGAEGIRFIQLKLDRGYLSLRRESGNRSGSWSACTGASNRTSCITYSSNR